MRNPVALPSPGGRHQDFSGHQRLLAAHHRLRQLKRRATQLSQIGLNGQELVEIFASGGEAGKVLEAVARAKRRRGYWDL